MYRILLTATVAAFAIAAPATAATPFDGTWKADVKTIKITAKDYKLGLKDGVYHCGLCLPEFDVKADGKFHPVPGHDYFDEVSVKIADPRTIVETDRKAGKLVSETTMVVAADDKSYTYNWVDSSAANGKVLKGSGRDTRVAKGAPGSHAIAGTWKQGNPDAISPEALTVTYKVEGDTLTMKDATGSSYAAKLGGPAVPMQGDLGKTMISAKKPAANTLVVTYARGGKTVGVGTSIVAADGKTIAAVYENKRDGSTTKYTAVKQ